MALSAPAAAEPVLDQQQPLFATNVTMGIGGGPLSDQKLGQVVTAGVAGRLTGVGLLIACDFGSVLQLQIQQAPL